MAKIHFVLQGKGGVGKSVVASIIAQYKMEGGPLPTCVDTDPVNASFTGYEALSTQRLEILVGDEINTRRFDDLIEIIAKSKNDVIIDNGSNAFVPLTHYLISNHVPSLLKEMGHETVIHTVITGGQALLDTIHGFNQLIVQFPEESHFIVWLNPYWGPVEVDGKSFEQMKAYLNNKERISALIQFPSLKEETYGRDFVEMLQAKTTFAEALKSDRLSIMSRQRLKIIRDKIFRQLDAAAAVV